MGTQFTAAWWNFGNIQGRTGLRLLSFMVMVTYTISQWRCVNVIGLYSYSLHLFSLTPFFEPISYRQPLADTQSLVLLSTQASARNKSFQVASWASQWWYRSMSHVGPHGEFGGDGVVRSHGTLGGTLPMLANQSKCGTTCESATYSIWQHLKLQSVDTYVLITGSGSKSPNSNYNFMLAWEYTTLLDTIIWSNCTGITSFLIIHYKKKHQHSEKWINGVPTVYSNYTYLTIWSLQMSFSSLKQKQNCCGTENSHLINQDWHFIWRSTHTMIIRINVLLVCVHRATFHKTRISKFYGI
jgi:hypothetical protein